MATTCIAIFKVAARYAATRWSGLKEEDTSLRVPQLGIAYVEINTTFPENLEISTFLSVKSKKGLECSFACFVYCHEFIPFFPGGVFLRPTLPLPPKNGLKESLSQTQTH